MGNLGLTELLLIGAVLLLFFGPSRLPQLGRSLGQGLGEFKKAAKALTDEPCPHPIHRYGGPWAPVSCENGLSGAHR